MAGKDNREKLRVLVSHAKADANLCAVAYQIIKASDPSERPQELMEFITSVRRDETDGSMKLPIVITKEEEISLMTRYGFYVDQKTAELIEEQLEEGEFYSRLADFIFNDEKLQDEMAGAIAIFDCMIDRRYPYHKIDMSDALTMTQEEYDVLREKIGEDTLETIDSALAFDYEQKTERAGVVLSLIDSGKTREERVIMLTRALGYYENQIMMLRRRELKRHLLRNLIEEDN